MHSGVQGQPLHVDPCCSDDTTAPCIQTRQGLVSCRVLDTSDDKKYQAIFSSVAPCRVPISTDGRSQASDQNRVRVFDTPFVSGSRRVLGSGHSHFLFFVPGFGHPWRPHHTTICRIQQQAQHNNLPNNHNTTTSTIQYQAPHNNIHNKRGLWNLKGIKL